MPDDGRWPRFLTVQCGTGCVQGYTILSWTRWFPAIVGHIGIHTLEPVKSGSSVTRMIKLCDFLILGK